MKKALSDNTPDNSRENASGIILRIHSPIECQIISKLNRFVVQIEIDGKAYPSSINNTGRLSELLIKGRLAFCLRHDKPLKTAFRLFAIEERGQGAIIDTQMQMRAFEAALEAGMIPWLKGWQMVRRNAPQGKSLLDYLLTDSRQEIYLEAKSAVLRDGDYATYPDCPTARGRKHIRELTRLALSGSKAAIVFIAALPEANAFKPDKNADPELCRLLKEAAIAGVAIHAINIAYRPDNSSIYLANSDMTVELD